MIELERADSLREALTQSVSEDAVVMCYTLRELYLVVAEKMDQNKRLSWTEFNQLYQDGMQQYGTQQAGLGAEVYAQINSAKLKKKLDTYKSFRDGNDWRKYQWLLETRFADFDPKTRGEFIEKEPAPAFVYTTRVINADEEA